MSLFRRNRSPESNPVSPTTKSDKPNQMEALYAAAQAERQAELIHEVELLRNQVNTLTNPRAMYRKKISEMLDPEDFRAKPTPEMKNQAIQLVMQALKEQQATLFKGIDSGRGTVHCSHCGAMTVDNIYRIVRFSSPDAYTLDESEPYDESRHVYFSTFEGSVELCDGYTSEDDVQSLRVSELNLHEMALHPELNPDLKERLTKILGGEEPPGSTTESPQSKSL